jgi:hypothetical protein
MIPEATLQRTEVCDDHAVDSQAVPPPRICSVIGRLLTCAPDMEMKAEHVDGKLRSPKVELNVEMVRKSNVIACVILPSLLPAVKAIILDA